MKNIFNKAVSKEQARKYARTVDAQFIILSNGIVRYLWDLKKRNPKPISNSLHQVKLEQFAT